MRHPDICVWGVGGCVCGGVHDDVRLLEIYKGRGDD